LIFRCQVDNQLYEIKLEWHDEQCHAILRDQDFIVEILDQRPGHIDLRVQDHSIRLYWAEQNGRTWISYKGCTYIVDKPVNRPSNKRSEKSGENIVRAPMPAQVRAVEIMEQAQAIKGQTIMLLEAMKMEIRITAPIDGQVTRIYVQPGQRVDQGQLLFELNSSVS